MSSFQLSPGVSVTETDLTNIIPAVATSTAALVGNFAWGPVGQIDLVSSKKELLENYGYPVVSFENPMGSTNRVDWYSASNFLGYSSGLLLVRTENENAANACSGYKKHVANKLTIDLEMMLDEDGTISLGDLDYSTIADDSDNLSISVPYSTVSNVTVAINGLETRANIMNALVTALVADGVTTAAYDTVLDCVTIDAAEVVDVPADVVISNIPVKYSMATNVDLDATSVSSSLIRNVDDFITVKSSLTEGSVYARYPGKIGNAIGFMIIDHGVNDSDWNNEQVIGSSTLSDIFDDKPATSVWAENIVGDIKDEVSVIVYTTSDALTGVKGEILERYQYLSKASNAKTADGAPNYYVDVINTNSKFVHVLKENVAVNSTSYVSGQHVVGANINTTSANVEFESFISNSQISGVRSYNLQGGLDGTSVTDGAYIDGYDLFADPEAVDVSLIISGAASKTVAKHLISICEARRDCIVMLSPDYESAVAHADAEKVVEYFNNSVDGFNSTSYAVFDSCWKRQYDTYSDEYFWMPINPDIVGIMARNDSNFEPWYSPAGLNRGFIQNVVKLSYSPNKAQRDALYSKRINPVVTFVGQGTVLYGDKTALSRPSAFDRINVRRLFIVLQKSIATAARYQLFEFNDELTRRVFINAVEPFLTEIKSKRGLTDFRVICDASNNTGEVIDSNRFVADIYIKPTRSINFINLNFIAVRSDVSFSEVTQ
jgi:phage tail sheath protein FI